jgi:hypothetical protein
MEKKEMKGGVKGLNEMIKGMSNEERFEVLNEMRKMMREEGGNGLEIEGVKMVKDKEGVKCYRCNKSNVMVIKGNKSVGVVGCIKDEDGVDRWFSRECLMKVVEEKRKGMSIKDCNVRFKDMMRKKSVEGMIKKGWL